MDEEAGKEKEKKIGECSAPAGGSSEQGTQLCLGNRDGEGQTDGEEGSEGENEGGKGMLFFQLMATCRLL